MFQKWLLGGLCLLAFSSHALPVGVAERVQRALGPRATVDEKADGVELLVELRDESPLEFLRIGGFFALVQLQVEAKEYAAALETFRTWPWERPEYSPWNFVAPEQLDFATYLVLKIVVENLPKRMVSFYNPMTNRMDDGRQLVEAASRFEVNFPGSVHLSKVDAVEQQLLEHRIQRLQYEIEFYSRGQDRKSAARTTAYAREELGEIYRRLAIVKKRRGAR